MSEEPPPSLEDLLACEGEPHAAPRERPEAPRVELDPTTGRGHATATLEGDQQADWSEILRSLGFDDKLIQVLDVTQVRAWHGYDGRVLRYVRAELAQRRSGADQVDVDALCAEVSAHEPSAGLNLCALTDEALVVALSDWQVGKGEGGGSEAFVARALRMIDLVSARLLRLRPASLVVLGMGDMVESCDGHYPMQAWSTDLDHRSQAKLVRRLLVKALTAWTPMVDRVDVACVPGNHGEKRKGGKAYTTFGDNADVEVFEQAAEVLQANPDAYGHVRFVVPDQELTVTLDACGTRIGLAHGHQATRGGSPQAKLLNWWRDMSHQRHPIGHADVLLTGHYHHLQVVQDGGRTWMQCPSLDGGSRWWEEQGGATTVAGTLTFLTKGGEWSGLEVLR